MGNTCVFEREGWKGRTLNARGPVSDPVRPGKGKKEQPIPTPTRNVMGENITDTEFDNCGNNDDI